MSVDQTRLRLGRIQRLWAQQFASLAFIGFAIGAIALTDVGHSGSPLPIGDKIVALIVAGTLLIVGAIGTWRCMHLYLSIDGSVARIRGITRNWRIPLKDVAFIGYGSTLLARSLYFVNADGRATMARGVSYQGGPKAPLPATEVLDTVRAAIEAAGGDLAVWNPDPRPDLPEAPPMEADRPPSGAVLEPVRLSPLYRANSRSMALAGIVVLFVVVGLQAGFPKTFPWILLAGIGLEVAYAAFTVLIYRRVSRRFSPMVATTADTVAFGTASKWRTLNLDDLAGIGAAWSALSPGFYGSTFTVTAVRLVDTEGRRLIFDGPTLTPRLHQLLHDRLNDSVQVTHLARQVLELPPTPGS